MGLCMGQGLRVSTLVRSLTSLDESRILTLSHGGVFPELDEDFEGAISGFGHGFERTILLFVNLMKKADIGD